MDHRRAIFVVCSVLFFLVFLGFLRQPQVSTRPRTQRPIATRVISTSRNFQHSAHCPDRMDGLIRSHEPEARFEGAHSVANKAAAFERINRSSLSLRFSRRNRASSSRSVLVSPPSPLPASRSSCFTHSE